MNRETPILNIELSLTTNTYHRSAPESKLPSLKVIATLRTPSVVTVELRGEFDTGTVLENGFRAEHFDFYDTTTSRYVVNNNPFSGTCEPRDEVSRDGVVELTSATPLITSRVLEDMSPLSDPVRQLVVGRIYRIRLKPQKLSCFLGAVDELFAAQEYVPVEELKSTIDVVSEDDLMLKIEA